MADDDTQNQAGENVGTAPDSLNALAETYGVTAEQLRMAVDAVGDRPEALEKYFSHLAGPA